MQYTKDKQSQEEAFLMNVSAHRAFSFLRTYGYERVSCSKEERTVAEALLNECTS